jgi:hypothetical protein
VRHEVAPTSHANAGVKVAELAAITVCWNPSAAPLR